MEWIDVKERLPETSDDVWVALPGGFVDTDYRYRDQWFLYDGTEAGWPEPTHWMPIPESPFPLHPNELANIALCERNDERSEIAEERKEDQE